MLTAIDARELMPKHYAEKELEWVLSKVKAQAECGNYVCYVEFTDTNRETLVDKLTELGYTLIINGESMGKPLYQISWKE